MKIAFYLAHPAHYHYFKISAHQLRKEGHEVIYISTGEEGLYEKYGYTYWQDMTDWNGGTSRVYRRFVK